MRQCQGLAPGPQSLQSLSQVGKGVSRCVASERKYGLYGSSPASVGLVLVSSGAGMGSTIAVFLASIARWIMDSES